MIDDPDIFRATMLPIDQHGDDAALRGYRGPTICSRTATSTGRPSGVIS
jgi:hypothetical protein